MEIKDRIKELRLLNRFTQNQMAEELNKIIISDTDQIVYTQTVSYWENGRDPSINSLIKLSKLFDVSVDYILGLEKENSVLEKWYEEDLNDLRTENLKKYFRSLDDKLFKTIIFMFNSYISYFFDVEEIGKNKSKEADIEDLTSIYYHHNIGASLKSLIQNSTRYNLSKNKEQSDLFLQEILNDKIRIDILLRNIIHDFSFGISQDKINKYLNEETLMIDDIFEDIQGNGNIKKEGD